jgi:hypothetical protein
MLRVATGDGGRKRAAGEKPSWKVDQEHEAAVWSHISKWKHGEKHDADSGAHPLVHLAWRALAIAWQEMKEEEAGLSAEAEKHLAKNCTICQIDGVRSDPEAKWKALGDYSD